MCDGEPSGWSCPEAVEETFEEYRGAPVRFCEEVLGAASATRSSAGTPYQREILESLASDSRVSVRSGHGIGKSTVNAWAAVWWPCSRPPSKVVNSYPCPGTEALCRLGVDLHGESPESL